MPRAIALVLVVGVTATVGGAHAQTAPEAPTAEQRREPSYYRGREPAEAPEEVLAWIPRVLFAPVALVTEFLVRRPLVGLLTWAEEESLLEAIELVLEPDPNVSWTPTLSFEAGVLALPGVSVTWRNFPWRGNALSVDFALGSDEFFAMRVSESVTLGPVGFGVRGGAESRPERPYFGLGNDSPSDRTFFSERRTWLEGFFELTHANHAKAELAVGWSMEEVGPGITPSIETLAPLDQVPGLGMYELGVARLQLTLDSRARLEEHGGVRFVGDGVVAVDSRDDSRLFMTVDLDLEAGVEVAAPGRVLIAHLYAASTMPFADDPVPFNHLATLGWDRHRGFIRGRWRGEAALMAEARYRYPIAYNVDAFWLSSVGNVFRRDGSDFDVGALTASFGVGLRTRGLGSTPLEVSFALGSRRFDDPAGFGIQSARLFFESRTGL